MRILDKICYYISRLINRRPASVYRSTISKYASIGNGAQIYKCSVGRYSYIYNSKVVDTSVGQFCSIAEECVIGGGAHPTTWVATSPIFYSGRNVFRKNLSQKQFNEYIHTEIGNDVWIGSKCLIKGGVKIGNGAIIGMGSVVTHDIPPYEIWAGNPAKFIRKRFDDELIKKLLNSTWWDWPEEKIRRYAICFDNPQELLAVIERGEEE